MPIVVLPCLLHIAVVLEPIACAEKHPMSAFVGEPAWHAVHAIFDEESQVSGTIARDFLDMAPVHRLLSVWATGVAVQFTTNSLQQLIRKYVPVIVHTHLLQQRPPFVVCEIGVVHCACLYFSAHLQDCFMHFYYLLHLYAYYLYFLSSCSKQ